MKYPKSTNQTVHQVTKNTKKKINHHIVPEIKYMDTQNDGEDEITKFMEKGVFTDDFVADEMPADHDDKASVKSAESEKFENYEFLDDAQQQDNQSNLNFDVPNTQTLGDVSMEQAKDFFKKVLNEMSSVAKELKNLKDEVVNLREVQTESNNRINELKEQIKTLTDSAGTNVTVAEESAKIDLIKQVPTISVEDSKIIKNFIITKSSTCQQLLDEMKELDSANDRIKMKHVCIVSISYLFKSFNFI